jgi:hypothetical protein
MIEYRSDGTGPEQEDGAPPDTRLKIDADAMDVDQLTSLIEDIRWQPDWRSESDLDAAYYDGFQISPETRARSEDSGQPIAVVNLMARAINTMLGQEAKARASWKVTSDMDDFQDVSDALNPKMVEAQRETYADMAISNAYASQVKCGIGWVEVSRKADLFADYRYRVADVHRNEIWWDWRARELDLSDARWLVRQRWIDQDEAEVMFPDKAQIFGAQMVDFNPILLAEQLSRQQIPLHEAYADYRRFQIQPDEWLDTGRRRIRFYEVWYRRKVPAVALIMRNQRVVVYDDKNPMHVMAAARNLGRLVRTWKTQMRCSIFAGPHQMSDREVKGCRFPYVPFWAYRDDADRTPYGMARGMRYPQDEYNARRSKLMWLLQSVQVFVDDDALNEKFNTIGDLANELMRPDALMVLNSNRRQKDGIQVRRDISLPNEQVTVMQDAKQLIQEQPGIFGQMLGQAENVRSGIAINSLVEQGVTAQGELNDNYRYSRRMVGEMLLQLIVEDMSEPNTQQTVGVGSSKRVVILNQFDPRVGAVVANKVADAPVKVALEDMPSTPAYRLQQQQQIAAVLQVGGADPAVRAVLIPSFIEATDLPNREHDAQLMRQMYGVPQPGDEAGMQQAQQAASQQRQQQQAAQTQATAAQAAESNASAELKTSHAALNRVKAVQAVHDMHMDAADGLNDKQHLAIEHQRAKVDALQGTAANDDSATINDVLARASQAASPRAVA